MQNKKMHTFILVEIYANTGQGHLILILYDNEGQKAIINCLFLQVAHTSITCLSK